MSDLPLRLGDLALWVISFRPLSTSAGLLGGLASQLLDHRYQKRHKQMSLLICSRGIDVTHDDFEDFVNSARVILYIRIERTGFR